MIRKYFMGSGVKSGVKIRVFTPLSELFACWKEVQKNRVAHCKKKLTVNNWQHDRSKGK